MDITQKRREFKNELYIRLKDAKVVRERSLETIKRLRVSTFALEFVKKQIGDLKELCAVKDQLIQDLERQIDSVDYGECDDEIEEIYKSTAKSTAKKQAEQALQAQTRTAEKEENKAAKQEMYANRRKIRDEAKQKRRDQRYHYKRFLKIIDTIPDYMNNLLKKMPNNRGFLWKGCYIYGERPSNSTTRLVTENRKGLTVTYSTTATETKVYEKPSGFANKKVKRKLVRVIPRKPITSEICLMDYQKN